jgi:hypothetical protein
VTALGVRIRNVPPAASQRAVSQRVLTTRGSPAGHALSHLAAIARLAERDNAKVLITGDHQRLAAVESGGGMNSSPAGVTGMIVSLLLMVAGIVVLARHAPVVVQRLAGSAAPADQAGQAGRRG